MNKIISFFTNMSAIEWVVFAAVILTLIFVLAHPVTTILVVVVCWFVSVAFRNTIKAAIAKWKS